MTMSDFDRYGGSTTADREPRYRDQNRSRTSIFGDRDQRFADRDQSRERRYRDNRPGGFGSGRNFTRDEDDVRRFRGEDRDRSRRDRYSGERDWRSSRSRGYDEDYGRDEYRGGLPIEETDRLIASNKVEGTPVYGREGERLGTIYNFMVDKRSGQVEYAVMSYGGFLGMGQRYFPLPWRILDYDVNEGGYHIDMDDRDLERAPSFDREDEPRFNRNYSARVHRWYGLDY
jgi:hypothetical protein